MNLVWKFNAALLAIFIVGFALASYVSYQVLQANAREEVLQHARIMMEAASSARVYTNTQVKPLLETQLKYRFLPQSVPAFAATEQFNDMRKKYPDYSYKEATLNPTNPRDHAADWEIDVVNMFRQTPSRLETFGERDTPDGRSLYLARPIQIKDPACLACHSVPSAAPVSMIKLYGESNGFGWKHQEIIGAQVVSVPMALPIKNANDAFVAFMGSLAAIFVVTFIVLNVMLTYMILKPISRMARAADKISTGDFNVPEFAKKGSDEIAGLGTSFNRMRRSLQKALKLIEK